MTFPPVSRHLALAQRALLSAGALLAVLGAAASLSAQQPQDPVKMTPVVTAATLLPESSATIGTSIDVISGADSARQQLTSLADALWGAPGGPAFATGRAGASDSLFLRGANSDQVLFLVDGIRFSDVNTDYGPFLGSWRTGSTDHLEIARGPQSTLYGAEAAGGVVSLTTPAGTLTSSQSLTVEAGSFGTVQGSLNAQGNLLGWGYNASASGGVTDNDRANNEFKSANAVLRLDHALTKSQSLAIGATVRGLDAAYGDPGDRFTNDPSDHEKEQDLLATVFVTAQLTENFSGKVTVGGQYRRFDTYEPDSLTVAKEERGVVSGQVTGRLTANNKLTAGFDLESDHDSDNGFGAINHRDDLTAFFAEDEFSPIQDVYVTAGLRHDAYSTFGSVDTGRATLAWLGPSHLIKLRGSYGTGFNAPSFLDLYARDPSFVGNPNVQPERSRGWDVGFDFYMPEDTSQVLSVTWFHTDYRNLIEDNFDVSPATTENVDRARTEGLEVAWKTQLAGAIQTKIAYTYLTADDLTTETALLRRPRNSGSADLDLDLKNGWTIGAGGLYVSRRADVDAVTFDTVQDPSYSSIRAYIRWQINPHLDLHARVENALNRLYEPVNGYPALPRGYFGGIDWKF